MESRDPTLDRLFEGNKEYRVPLYQRLYVWTKDDQWAPLWEDIIAVAEKVMKLGANDTSPHFFGALVLKKSEGITDDDANVYRVIDGQQRLTTMQLLIAAVADEMWIKSTAHQRASRRLKELIVNPSYAEPKSRYKMRHSGQNYATFREVMQANGNVDAVEALGGEMAECYLYFRNAVNSWLDDANSLARSNALTTTLRTKLQTVAIYLAQTEPEHLIFETLNARGKPLTEWDKIRNYLFYRIQREQDSFFQNYLARFDDDWWRGKSGAGPDVRPRTDRFVDYWLESKFFRAVSQTRVFREYREWADTLGDADLVNEVSIMMADASHYERFEKDNGLGTTDVETLFHERRRRMRFGAFWPLLFGVRRANFNDAENERLLSSLESWLVRRWICGYQARGYPDRALALLRIISASDKTKNVIDDMITSLESIEDTVGWWPGDNEVLAAILGRRPSVAKSRFVLEAVERQITPPQAGKEMSFAGQLQIEHLMPTGWDARSWPLSEDSQEARDTRNALIRTVGNLTLIHGRLNARMSNATWKKKRSAIEESDNLFLNRRILKQAPEEWNEEAIRARGRWIGEQVCDIWPHADALRRRLAGA